MITALIYFAPYFTHEGYNTDTEYAHSTLQCYIITPIHMITVLKYFAPNFMHEGYNTDTEYTCP